MHNDALSTTAAASKQHRIGSLKPDRTRKNATEAELLTHCTEDGGTSLKRLSDSGREAVKCGMCYRTHNIAIH